MKKSDDSCSRAQNARTQGQKNLLITVASCLIFFVAVPCVIYYCAYIPYFAPNGGVSVRRVVEAAKGMFAYHSTPGLGMDHPFYSPWYEWPLSIKPMYYAADQYEPAGFACTILAFGNPAVWWVGIVCLMTVLVMFGIRGWKALSGRGQMDCRLPLLLISFAAQFLPWMLVPRGTYIYHYFPSVPFIILCTALCLEKLETVCTEWEMSRGGSGSTANHASLALIGLYILIVLALFIALFPYASGMLTPVSWLNSVNWFHNLYY